MTNKIKIPFSESDIQDLADGGVFEWSMGGRDMYIYNEDTHALLCADDLCMNLQDEDGEYCSLHKK